jgi:hypothetical protein
MTGDELRKACGLLYGEQAGQTRMAEALEVDPSTVRRWISGALPIPGPVRAAVGCFLKAAGKTLDRGRKKP